MDIFTKYMITDILGVFVAILVVIYAYLKWSYHYWQRHNVPYFEPTIPYGNISAPHKRVIPIGDEVVNLYKAAKLKGWKYLGIYMLTTPTFLVMDLDLIKRVMTKDFNYFSDRGMYVNEKDEPIGAHLFSIGGLKWRNLRTKFTPTFTSGKMRSMFQTLVDCGLVLEKYIEEKCYLKEPIDAKSVLACFSTDVIGSCAFGLECNTFENPDSPFRQFGKRIFEKNKIEALKIAFASNYPTLANFFGMCLFPKDLTHFFTQTVEQTVAYREKNNIVRKDFLQMLIEIRNHEEKQATEFKGDGKTLTIDEMVAQSFLFFLAGFETSSTTMTFALYELSVNPDMQEKVREELKRVLKEHNNEITYDSLKALEYMGQVIDETLRKYPPAPFVTRQCTEDYNVPNSDVVIEKGTRVIIPIKAVHYDEEYYEQPEIFDPERFKEEYKRNRHQYSFLPFGEGPRICLGMRFGVMQTKVGLACLLRNCKVKLSEKTKVPLKMSVKSFMSAAEGGIWLNIEKI